MSLDVAVIGFVPGDALYESRKGFENSFRLIALRRVTAIGENKNLDWARSLFCDGFDLRHSSVLVVNTLNHENRARNAREICFDIPVSEVRMKPDVVPSPECASGIAMMATELLRQVCRFEFHLGFGDACHAEVLDEDMRSEENEATHAIAHSSVDERDGRSVAVPDQNWTIDFELREKVGKRGEGFVMHVGNSAILREQVGIAGTVARIDGDRAPGCIGDARRKIFPVGYRAEAFMQEDEFRSVRKATRNAENFEAVALDGKLECTGGGGIHMRSGIMLQSDFGVQFGPREIPPYA